MILHILLIKLVDRNKDVKFESSATSIGNVVSCFGLGVLVAVLYLTENEGVAALTALGSLLPYYFLLWLRRDSIQRGISFHIEE